MKKLIPIFILLLATTNAHAAFYIFNKDNQCIGKAEYEPDAKDLKSRGEFVFFSKKDLSIANLEYFQNDIRERPKTQEEKNEEKRLKEVSDEMAKIEKRMRKKAYEELKTEGVKFKHLTDADFTEVK